MSGTSILDSLVAPQGAPPVWSPPPGFHPAPDGSGVHTDLSDADYTKYMAGPASQAEDPNLVKHFAVAPEKSLPQVNLPQIDLGGSGQGRDIAGDGSGIYALPAPGAVDPPSSGAVIGVDNAKPTAEPSKTSLLDSLPLTKLPGAPEEPTTPQMTGLSRQLALPASNLVEGAIGAIGFPGNVARGVTTLGGQEAASSLQGNPLPQVSTFFPQGKTPLEPIAPQMLAAAPGKREITPPSGHNPLDTESLMGLTNAAGITNRPDLTPQNLTERAEAAAAQGVGVVAPSLLTGGLSAAPAVGSAIRSTFNVARPLLSGAALGLGGEFGGDAGQAVGGAPGHVIGSTIGSVLPALAGAGVSKVASVAKPILQKMAPVTSGIQADIAARSFADANTPANRAALTNPSELTPGSPATSYQVTGDPTLGTAERGIANQKAYAPAFNELRQRQNASRVASIEGQAPRDADVGGIVPWFRGRLQQMREDEAWDLGSARDAGAFGENPEDSPLHIGLGSKVRSSVDAMGNLIAPHEAGGIVRSAVEVAREPKVTQSNQAIQAAQTRAQQEAGALGGEGLDPQAEGSRMRGNRPSGETEGSGIQGQRAKERASANRLYDAVDPEGKLIAGGLAPTGDTAAILRGDKPPRNGWSVGPDRTDSLSEISGASRADLDGAEAKVLDFAASFHDAEKFQDVRKLQRMIAAAQRDIGPRLGYESLPYKRMTELRNATEDALTNAAGEAAKEDATVAEKLAAMAKEENNGPVSGGSGGRGNENGSGGGSAGVSGEGGEQGAEGERRGIDASDSGLADESPTGHLPGDLTDLEKGIYGDLAPQTAPTRQRLAPNLEPEDVDKLRKANANYADYKAKFGRGAVGGVLKPSNKTISGFAVEDSGVPTKLFAKGPAGAEAADSLIAAVGHDGALKVLGEYPAYSLRQAAEDMGTLNVKKYEKWAADHAGVLDKFPELKASFDSAAKARAVLDDLKAERAALDKTNPIKTEADNAQVIRQYVLPGPRGYEGAERLVRDTNGSPEALQATRDYLASDLRRDAMVRTGPNAQTLDQGAYTRWMKDHDGFLSHPALADTRAAFSDAGRAQEVLDAAAHGHVAAQKAYTESVARHFLGPDVDPVKSMGGILSRRDPGPELADLGRQTSGDPNAREAIQSSVIHAILDRIKSNNPVGANLEETYLKANETQKLIGDLVGGDLNGPLRHIMTPEQLDALNKTRMDIRRANLSISGNRPVSGGSDTGLITSAREDDSHSPSIVGALTMMEGAGVVGEHLLDTKWGKVIGAAGSLIMNMARKAGFQTVNDLRAAALLDPAKMSALLARVPNDVSMPSRLAAIRGQLAAYATVSGARATNDDQDMKVAQ